MNATNTLLGALCAALFSLWSPAADAGTISYTYDPAGRLVAVDYGANITTSYAYDPAGNLLQTTAPSPGFAFSPIVNYQLTLAWPANPGGFTLEASATLGSAALWTPVAPAPVLVGNQYTGTVNVLSGPQFLRLRKP